MRIPSMPRRLRKPTPASRLPNFGVARYLLNPGGESAEFAVVVADDWPGRGLGSRLMNGICELARSNGLQCIERVILANNRNVLKLMRGLGFAIHLEPDDPVMRIAAKAL